ncbi:alpha/beta hydrolase fold-3 domain-containing protein [Periconia macrospinosa]|uniref:Alpha/beta hydrolase fold-3 domain-containing protein n=1 Tax=Periconia macrospinosa TaxID=97972 RepID=A0A2V1D4E3_9PLEO|nr:alpha/beta hydrolase fold-3 domain-containing protein [Periconia macrospinosa]
MTVWSKQPFKTLYTLFFISQLCVLIPISLLRYIPQASRPNARWNLKQCVIRVVAQQLFIYYTKTQASGVSSVEAGHKRAKARFALAEPAEASLYTGVLASGKAQPATVGGLWYPEGVSSEGAAADFKDKKVVLHFPGGAFVLAFGTDGIGHDISHVMQRGLGNSTMTFLAQYRVSKDAGTRFPAALQDLVTIYRHVLSMGVEPHNVILSGDSAAGNLVIGLLRYIEDVDSARLPCPGGAMLWSPWVHVTPTAGRDYESSRNAPRDILTGDLLQWGADAYFPEGTVGEDVKPFISPLGHPFKTSVPLFIHACGSEAFFDPVKGFAQEMSDTEGNRIRFHETEIAPHDLLMSFKGFGLDSEMEIAAKDAHDFFE